MHQRQEECHRIPEELPDRLNGSGGIPEQILKDVHGRRVAIVPHNQQNRKSLFHKHDGVFRGHNRFNRSQAMKHLRIMNLGVANEE